MPTFSKLLFATVIIAALALTACAPAGPSADQIQAQIQTSVAMTVASQNTQTAEAQPAAAETDTPAATPANTDTPIPVPTLGPLLTFPTATAVVVSGGGGGGGGSVASLAYSCDQVDWRPLDGSVFFPGEHFLVKWTLLNNGTKQWCEGGTCSGGPDLRFTSGTNFLAPLTGPIQVPSLKPHQTYVVPTMGGVAPKKPGSYVMYWKLEDMQNSTCAYISIVVK
jgi:hypothetical protein